jgi:hypothetical protein
MTPCAIPIWLPGNIVYEMVLEFSRRLGDELSKLQVTRGLRGRSNTSDTARMSSESLGDELPKEVPKEGNAIASLKRSMM